MLRIFFYKLFISLQVQKFINEKMAEDKATVQEFKLDPECELRFELESKNEKVTLEVCRKYSFFKYKIYKFTLINKLIND